MVKIGRQKTWPNTLVSPAPVGWRTLAEKVYCMVTCNNCMVTCDNCMATCDKCMVTCDKCMVTCDKCMVTCDNCMITCDNCLLIILQIGHMPARSMTVQPRHDCFRRTQWVVQHGQQRHSGSHKPGETVECCRVGVDTERNAIGTLLLHNELVEFLYNQTSLHSSRVRTINK